MIELHSNQLVFSFPNLTTRLRARLQAWADARIAAATTAERAALPSSRNKIYARLASVLPEVRATISFQRTLRVPDDGKNYPLPPGLGKFPIRHVDDFSRVPEAWRKRGGVMLPMQATEATWLQFSGDYPMALKISAGGICAVSGLRWDPVLVESPQNYVVLGLQPWLDGFRISPEVVRQFVAVPLGKGLTVEQQLTGGESWGGLQLQAFPLRDETFWDESIQNDLERRWQELVSPVSKRSAESAFDMLAGCAAAPASAGLGAGGRIEQKISHDPHGLAAWDLSETSRCFIHLCLARDWRNLTGARPPHPGPTAQDYASAGLPWFDYDAPGAAVQGETTLSEIKSVNTLVVEKTGIKLPANESIAPTPVLTIKAHPRTVREF